MKKVVVVVILAVYLASIAIVNFFGLKVSIFEGTTYVTEIKVERVVLQRNGGTEVDSYKDNVGVVNYSFEFKNPDSGLSAYSIDDESIISNPNTVLIDFRVYPGEASNKNVNFIFSKKIGVEDNKVLLGIGNRVQAVFLKDKHVIIFLQPRFIVDITIRATDGSNVSTDLCVYAKKPRS